MWRKLPRLSSQGEAQRPRQRQFVLIYVLLLSGTALASSAAPWSALAKPARLVNGAPVLFQVKPPAKLDSLSGTWLGHQLTFSYDDSTRTWVTLAGVSIETTPGKYPLELSAERAAAKTPLTVTHTFAVARTQYPQIKVELTVEKKFTEPTPEQQAQI